MRKLGHRIKPKAIRCDVFASATLAVANYGDRIAKKLGLTPHEKDRLGAVLAVLWAERNQEKKP